MGNNIRIFYHKPTIFSAKYTTAQSNCERDRSDAHDLCQTQLHSQHHFNTSTVPSFVLLHDKGRKYIYVYIIDI